MLFNATLTQVSPPPPAPAGSAREDRCALCPPTASDVQWLHEMNLAATAAVYLPPPPPPQATIAVNVGDLLVVQLDGQSPTRWQAVDVAERVGAAIRYVRIFVIPDPG